MKSKYNFCLYDLNHASLVLFKEVSDILSKVDNDFVSISENCQRVIEDNIIEENFKNGVLIVNEPAWRWPPPKRPRPSPGWPRRRRS